MLSEYEYKLLLDIFNNNNDFFWDGLTEWQRDKFFDKLYAK